MQPSFETFQADMLSQGFDEVIKREWAPLQTVGEHTHPFAVKAQLVQGELWLKVGDTVQHIRPGGGFELDPNVVHSERYGAEGAIFWVGRRHVVTTTTPATPA